MNAEISSEAKRLTECSIKLSYRRHQIFESWFSLAIRPWRRKEERWGKWGREASHLNILFLIPLWHTMRLHDNSYRKYSKIAKMESGRGGMTDVEWHACFKVVVELEGFRLCLFSPHFPLAPSFSYWPTIPHISLLPSQIYILCPHSLPPPWERVCYYYVITPCVSGVLTVESLTGTVRWVTPICFRLSKFLTDFSINVDKSYCTDSLFVSQIEQSGGSLIVAAGNRPSGSSRQLGRLETQWNSVAQSVAITRKQVSRRMICWRHICHGCPDTSPHPNTGGTCPVTWSEKCSPRLFRSDCGLVP